MHDPLPFIRAILRCEGRYSGHAFISHALAGARRLAEVRDAAGHSSVLVTSVYLHVAVEDEGASASCSEGESERRPRSSEVRWPPHAALQAPSVNGA